MKPNWTPEQAELISIVARRYKEGAKQETIAKELGFNTLDSLRARLLHAGVKFKRDGLQLVYTINGEPVDFSVIAV